MKWFVAESYDSEPRIDEAAGIIYDVLVVGRKAKNGRRYLAEAKEEAVKRGLYEHLQLYIGPHKRSRYAKRSPNEHAGELFNVRYANDEIRADLRYNQASEGGKLCLEIAKRFPKAFGLSHHGFVEGFVKNGEKIVDHILEVTMADIVKDPGTVDGVFEEVDVQPEATPAPPEKKTVDEGIVDLQTCILSNKDLDDPTKEKAIKWLHKLKALLGKKPTEEDDDEEEEAEEAVTAASLRRMIREELAANPKPPKPPVPEPTEEPVSTPPQPAPKPAPAPAPAPKPTPKRAPMSSARAEVTEAVEPPKKPRKRSEILKAYNVEG